MSLWKSLFLALLCFLASCASSHRYPLAICAIFKNEAPWLEEWIIYHHKVLGVQKFYLYNNDSEDNYGAVLKPFIEQGIVELMDWASRDPSHWEKNPHIDVPWVAVQLGAYNDCLKKRALGNARWVAMIDIDEYIVPTKGIKPFYAFLREAERRRKGTVRLFWKVFGTSAVETLEPGQLMIEKLLWRSQDDHPWNRQVKSIHRPEAVAFCLVHEAKEMQEGFRRHIMGIDCASIHHYWTRTAEACRSKRKLSDEQLEAFHQVQDDTILQYVPLLRS
jgi:hypothetical protein